MRTFFMHHAAIAGFALLITACSGQTGEQGTAQETAGAPDQAGVEDQADVATGTAATSGGSAAPLPSAGGSLSAYVGKYPFDEVGGFAWMANPTVAAGISKTVSDAGVRMAITETSGPSGPITLYQGKVTSWACEQRNCGDHQWAIMVDPKSGATDVCYHNAAKLPGKSRWFMANGSEEQREGNCTVA